MICFTTLIFTLLLSHIARAMPACGDVASPHDTYDLYDNEQLVFTSYNAVFNPMYENGDGNTMGVACSDGANGLASRYPKFRDIPGFPYIGGAFDVTWGSPNCGKCWKLHNKKTNKSISLIAIDAAGTGFNIAKEAFIKLGGNVDSGTLEVEARPVPPSVCGFK